MFFTSGSAGVLEEKKTSTLTGLVSFNMSSAESMSLSSGVVSNLMEASSLMEDSESSMDTVCMDSALLTESV